MKNAEEELNPRWKSVMTRIYGVASSITNIRAMRQFGPLLHEYDQTHYDGHDANDNFHNSLYKQDTNKINSNLTIDFNDNKNDAKYLTLVSFVLILLLNQDLLRFSFK